MAGVSSRRVRRVARVGFIGAAALNAAAMGDLSVLGPEFLGGARHRLLPH
jgi:hypothetical protein